MPPSVLSSANVHSRTPLPRAAHSASASGNVTASPPNPPVTGLLKAPFPPSPLTELVQIESKQLPSASQHWIAPAPSSGKHANVSSAAIHVKTQRAAGVGEEVGAVGDTVGDSLVGDAVVGDALVGDVVVGTAVVGAAVVGDAVVGEAVGAAVGTAVVGAVLGAAVGGPPGGVAGGGAAGGGVAGGIEG